MKKFIALTCLFLFASFASGQVYINGVLQGGSSYSYLWSGGISMLAPTTDVTPDPLLLKGADAWPGATSNTTGANTILAGGIGRRIFTILDYTQLAGTTVTITVNGIATIKTENVDWYNTTSDEATSISLASSINAIAGVTATAGTDDDGGKDVRIVPDVGTHSLTIAKTANDRDMVMNSGADGYVEISTNIIAHTAITAVGTAAYNGAIRTGVYKRAWTNDEIVALDPTGALLAADLLVATLPAKTIVRNAYVVIDRQATGLDTATVALGRTGATYIDYIAAGNAMVAANTVYGDIVAERGANLTGYDLPSYIGTTGVYLHFIVTDAGADTLHDIKSCTGTVYLLTEILP